MKMKYIAIVCLLLSLCSKNELMAQKVFDVAIQRNILETPKKRVYTEAKQNKNEIQFVFSNLFLFYKTFVSSQDMNVCTFSPSCSEFGILAVKKHGLVMGGVRTMDRLTRCNGLSPEKYKVDPKTRTLIDKP